MCPFIQKSLCKSITYKKRNFNLSKFVLKLLSSSNCLPYSTRFIEQILLKHKSILVIYIFLNIVFNNYTSKFDFKI